MSDYQIGDVIAGVPFGIGVAKITATCSGDDPHPNDCDDPDPDDGGFAGEPMSCVGEHFPASYSPIPCEITRLRAENDALRSEVGGLRLRIAAMEMTYRAALADRAVPARVVSPLHRALTVRPGAFGLHTGLEG